LTVAEDHVIDGGAGMTYDKREDFNPRGPGARAAIARALISSGVSLWHGIPEKIIDELYAADYKIKKKKKKKSTKQEA